MYFDLNPNSKSGLLVHQETYNILWHIYICMTQYILVSYLSFLRVQKCEQFFDLIFEFIYLSTLYLNQYLNICVWKGQILLEQKYPHYYTIVRWEGQQLKKI